MVDEAEELVAVPALVGMEAGASAGVDVAAALLVGSAIVSEGGILDGWMDAIERRC